jgi:hypothetical protein
VVDASDEPVHGSDKADYRLQYAIGLFDLGMKEMALTGTGQGEKASNFKSFGGKDIVMGDRAEPPQRKICLNIASSCSEWLKTILAGFASIYHGFTPARLDGFLKF